ncbi:response regulator [Beggiatoa leptomitoformis]|uniref:histidine kinase n=1 Tax=Beggiatoa leptomitoformis TaxID=288004 RepID=A0A2N9YIQ0_9GAMM|nr:response regulator [Beggiatoa leptomitoformis]ALG67489.1 response regulator [Beggiatoa leptomitoformis]AUI70289.1 response regulator [Beggiatoa leptomitoformis]
MTDKPSHPHILIVDDKPANIQFLGMVLRQQEYLISVAQDGYQAIRIVDKITPDLILLDIMMPGIDGFETCLQLKKKPHTNSVPIIFLTAKDDAEDIIKGFQLGAADYVTKPFNSSVLLARVATHLALRQKTQQLEQQQQEIKTALQISQEKYRFLVENQTDFVIKLDAQGRFLFASPSYCEKLQKTEEQLLNTFFSQHLLTEEQEVFHHICTVLQQAPHIYSVELQLLQPDAIHWIAWSCKAILNPQGQLTEIISVGRDVTARRQAEEKARQTLHELAHISRLNSMGEMTTALAHEINQPLTAILSFAQAGLRLLDSPHLELEDLRLALEGIERNGKLSSEIIKRIRFFARKDKQLHKQPLDINQLIKEVEYLVRPELRRNQVNLSLHLLPIPFMTIVDNIQIQQVILNLIRNAMDAILSATTVLREIIIKTQIVAKNYLEVAVFDTGIGIDPQIKQTLFEPFITTKAHGIGIGLSICRSIIEEHGGQLQFMDNPQGGSIFLFTLPINETEQ